MRVSAELFPELEKVNVKTLYIAAGQNVKGLLALGEWDPQNYNLVYEEDYSWTSIKKGATPFFGEASTSSLWGLPSER